MRVATFPIAELAHSAPTPPKIAMKVLILVRVLFLSAGLGWSATAVAEAVEQSGAAPGDERAFEPLDAEALIAACAVAASEREDYTANDVRQDKIVYIECLREAILKEFSGVIAGRLVLAERDGADMVEQRSYWEGQAGWLADHKRSCIPSCADLDDLYVDLDHAVMVGEAVLRDFVAERNLYADGRSRLSQPVDADALTEACRKISNEMAMNTGVTGLIRWGILRSAICLEYVILDQVAIMFESEYLSRQEMRKKIDDIRNAYGSFYWSLYNGHRGCEPCGTMNQVVHLFAYTELLKGMVKDIIRQRQRYGL